MAGLADKAAGAKYFSHPIQLTGGGSGEISSAVTERAYEVYRHLFGSRQTLERLNERGGFSEGDLITLLYARSFPRDEWAERDKEALRGMVKR